jgi:hypothetical protein
MTYIVFLWQLVKDDGDVGFTPKVQKLVQVSWGNRIMEYLKLNYRSRQGSM